MSTSTASLPQTLRLSSADDPLLALRAAHERGWPHPHTLRNYVHAGRLPAVRVGKQFMVKESDLKRLMTPVNVVDSAPERQLSSEADFTDLAALAARMVASWPRLTEQRKAELSRLLAA
ncbi:helix-turn-helix domain-containing protein [Arthrobacter sp. KNU40]|uniref:helix-turn-helix domain-containing protein n=1 Tax=Arthrobacter sp. KNU40 TaxID=3447965 RepID=UPI003F630488